MAAKGARKWGMVVTALVPTLKGAARSSTCACTCKLTSMSMSIVLILITHKVATLHVI